MVPLYSLSLTCRFIPYRRAGFAKSRSVHARGCTAGQKNCGKSGLGHQAAGPLGLRGAGPWAAAGPSNRRAAGSRAVGRGPGFSKTHRRAHKKGRNSHPRTLH